MRLTATASGTYPRIGDQPEEQVLRKTIAAVDRGEKTEADIEEARQAMVRMAIADQEEAGLDIVTDGQIGWYDPISHLLRSVAGVEINGLLRYFDTNSYFRQPCNRNRSGFGRYRPANHCPRRSQSGLPLSSFGTCILCRRPAFCHQALSRGKVE